MTQQYFFCATSRFALQGGCNFRKYTLILVSINLSNYAPIGYLRRGLHINADKLKY